MHKRKRRYFFLTFFHEHFQQTKKRILTVDFLTDRLPIDLISGLLVYRAHRITDSSPESFIVRLFRYKNKTGFIKAFTDSALDFTRGYNQLECVMKNLFLRHVFLYPRFQETIRCTFDKCSPDVIELQVPMTTLMMNIQISLMELINSCLQELRSATSWIDGELLTSDQAILSSFERLIRNQLQSVWNQIGIRAKQLLNDIKTLRLFVLYLTQYDCVTFYNAVQAVFVNEKLYGSRGKNIHSSQGATGSWLYLPAADRLLAVIYHFNNYKTLSLDFNSNKFLQYHFRRLSVVSLARTM